MPATSCVCRSDREAVQPERERGAQWRADDRKATASKASEVPALPAPAFIALDVQPEAEIPGRDIRIELTRGSATAVVHWPVESASSCATWLREWLR